MVALTSARESSSSSAASIVSTSCASTGTLIATSPGSSENQPTSLTTSGFPSERERMTLPDVSPMVGWRRLTHTSTPAMSAHRRASSTQLCRTRPSSASPSRWRRRSRSNPGDVGPTSRSVARWWRSRTRAKARRSSGIRLLALTTPKQPIVGPAATSSGSTSGTGHAGCGTTQIGPSKPAARASACTVREWTISPVACWSTNPASGNSSGLDSQSGGMRLSRTPWPRRRPTTPCSRSIASRYPWPSRRPTVIPATRWCSTKSCSTTTPGRRRSASTIQACESGLLPTWYRATSAPRAARLRPRLATSTSSLRSSAGSKRAL